MLHSPSSDKEYPKRGCGAVGSASEWHSEGQRFEPAQLHQDKTRLARVLLFLGFLILARESPKCGTDAERPIFTPRLPVVGSPVARTG